jgi:hypothetical protein
MKTNILILFNLAAILSFTGCDLEYLLSGEFSKEDTYTDEYILSPPDCDGSIYCGSMIYSNHQEDAYINLTVTNASPHMSAHDVQCDVSITDNGVSVTAKTISSGLIYPGESVSTSFWMSVYNPKKMYNDIECIISWYDADNNYYEDVKLGRI